MIDSFGVLSSLMSFQQEINVAADRALQSLATVNGIDDARDGLRAKLAGNDPALALEAALQLSEMPPKVVFGVDFGADSFSGVHVKSAVPHFIPLPRGTR